MDERDSRKKIKQRTTGFDEAIRELLAVCSGVTSPAPKLLDAYHEVCGDLQLSIIKQTVAHLVKTRTYHCSPAALKAEIEKQNEVRIPAFYNQPPVPGPYNVEPNPPTDEELARVRAMCDGLRGQLAAVTVKETEWIGPAQAKWHECDHAARFKSHHTLGDYCPTCDSFSEQWEGVIS